MADVLCWAGAIWWLFIMKLYVVQHNNVLSYSHIVATS